MLRGGYSQSDNVLIKINISTKSSQFCSARVEQVLAMSIGEPISFLNSGNSKSMPLEELYDGLR